MPNIKRRIGIAASLVTLMAAAPALAQGGAAAGGGGGGGGGAGGGGAPAPPPVATSCARITAFSNTTGYYSVWAAIWSKYGIANSCGGAVSWEMTYMNGTTGLVDFVRSGTTYYPTASGTVDEDWAAVATPYTVTLSVRDASGAVLDSQSAVITTKTGKNAIA
jgi:hypothetical protein